MNPPASSPAPRRVTSSIRRPGDEDDLALDFDAWGRTTLAVPGTPDPSRTSWTP